MNCFICNNTCELLMPDRDQDSQVLRNICVKCLDKFLFIYPQLTKVIVNRELGLKTTLVVHKSNLTNLVVNIFFHEIEVFSLLHAIIFLIPLPLRLH